MSNDEQSSGAGTEPGKPEPKHPFPLAVDIGGTGLKASVLGAAGLMVADRVKVATTYPLPPEKLVTVLTKLVAPLPQAERASVGFPGMVRDGKILSAPHFSTKSGPGSAVDPDLAKQWDDFDLASALSSSFGLPTKVTITLGTGFGTGLFYNGQMLPHLEVAHQPFRKGETYNDQLGEAARKAIGEERWNKRVHKAIANLRALMFFDRLYIGGGNSRRVNRSHLADDVTIVDNTAGILGGIKLWGTDHIGVNDAPE
jgi:polyphosphate glucokinase